MVRAPSSALVTPGWEIATAMATKTGLASALHSGDPAYDDLPQHLLDRLEPAAQTLLARAVDVGCVRADITAREVLTTVALLCHPVPGEPPSFTRRMVQIFTDGLTRRDI